MSMKRFDNLVEGAYRDPIEVYADTYLNISGEPNTKTCRVVISGKSYKADLNVGLDPVLNDLIYNTLQTLKDGHPSTQSLVPNPLTKPSQRTSSYMDSLRDSVKNMWNKNKRHVEIQSVRINQPIVNNVSNISERTPVSWNNEKQKNGLQSQPKRGFLGFVKKRLQYPVEICSNKTFMGSNADKSPRSNWCYKKGSRTKSHSEKRDSHPDETNARRKTRFRPRYGNHGTQLKKKKHGAGIEAGKGSGDYKRNITKEKGSDTELRRSPSQASFEETLFVRRSPNRVESSVDFISIREPDSKGSGDYFDKIIRGNNKKSKESKTFRSPSQVSFEETLEVRTLRRSMSTQYMSNDFVSIGEPKQYEREVAKTDAHTGMSDFTIGKENAEGERGIWNADIKNHRVAVMSTVDKGFDKEEIVFPESTRRKLRNLKSLVRDVSAQVVEEKIFTEGGKTKLSVSCKGEKETCTKAVMESLNVVIEDVLKTSSKTYIEFSKDSGFSISPVRKSREGMHKKKYICIPRTISGRRTGLSMMGTRKGYRKPSGRKSEDLSVRPTQLRKSTSRRDPKCTKCSRMRLGRSLFASRGLMSPRALESGSRRVTSHVHKSSVLPKEGLDPKRKSANFSKRSSKNRFKVFNTSGRYGLFLKGRNANAYHSTCLRHHLPFGIMDETISKDMGHKKPGKINIKKPEHSKPRERIPCRVKTFLREDSKKFMHEQEIVGDITSLLGINRNIKIEKPEVSEVRCSSCSYVVLDNVEETMYAKLEERKRLMWKLWHQALGDNDFFPGNTYDVIHTICFGKTVRVTKTDATGNKTTPKIRKTPNFLSDISLTPSESPLHDGAI